MDRLPSENTTAASAQRESELFCDPNADVTFISFDHVIFRLHGKHINSGSAGFSIPENITVGPEPVPLLEPSTTLEILFQFVEPPSEARNYRQPSVLNMNPSLLFAVAEAAEKYIVYGAMNVCLTRMQQLLSDYPLEVLNHCAKHGYTDLADQAAEKVLSQPFDRIALKLTTPAVLQRWLIYYNRWRQAVEFAIGMFEEQDPHRCLVSSRGYALYLRQINENPLSIFTLPTIPDDSMKKCSTLLDTCLCNWLDDPHPPWLLSEADCTVEIQKFSSITV